MALSVKDIVKNNVVRFSYYRAGYLYYNVSVDNIEYIFPVPIEDVGEERQFKYVSEVAGNKTEKMATWTLIDWIESKYVSNLAPLYGKSISIFNYD